MATIYKHHNDNLTPDEIAAGHTAQVGHPSNPATEHVHEGHMVKMIAPPYPDDGYDQKTGHYYGDNAKVEEPDPNNPAGTRHTVMVWPVHVGVMLQRGYRLADPDEPTASRRRQREFERTQEAEAAALVAESPAVAPESLPQDEPPGSGKGKKG